MRMGEVSSDAFGPNWVWRKELFLTFIISEVIFLLLIWVPSQRSQVRRFRIKLSLAERFVPYLFQFERNLLIGTSITNEKHSQRNWTKQILTAILSGGDGFLSWLKKRSLIRQKLIPICIPGLPICVRGGRQEILHMGSPRSHTKFVRILGAIYMLLPICAQFRYISLFEWL